MKHEASYKLWVPGTLNGVERVTSFLFERLPIIGGPDFVARRYGVSENDQDHAGSRIYGSFVPIS